MYEWPELTLNAAKELAEKIMPLIAGEIGKLQKMPLELNPSNIIELKYNLGLLSDLMVETDRKHFSAYSAMLNCLANGEITKN